MFIHEMRFSMGAQFSGPGSPNDPEHDWLEGKGSQPKRSWGQFGFSARSEVVPRGRGSFVLVRSLGIEKGRKRASFSLVAALSCLY
jgi:hypothetical protein